MAQGLNPHKMGRDIRGIISSLTNNHLAKPVDATDDGGLGIISFVGTNNGAVMKADVQEHEDIGEDKLSAFTNSNYQAINNSILVDGKCECEDPGIHIEIVDNYDDDEKEHDDDEDAAGRKVKEEKKKKKKKKQQHSEGEGEKVKEEKKKKKKHSEGEGEKVKEEKKKDKKENKKQSDGEESELSE